MKFNLKAGKYICIDPCYIFPDEEWSDLCDCFEYKGFKKQKGNCSSFTRVDQCEGLEMSYKGEKFVVIGTRHGDGGYPIKNGRQIIGELSVDAGLLAVIPLELATSWPEFEEKKDLGVIVEIKCDTVLNVSGGNFDFGRFSVKTDDDEEDSY